ncbi:MAG: hypothetical protein Ct9H300mP12_09580 [Acidimicrobiales bacterium]|nr:MAG: hypothetical protein Ct9H300mP12_09580 [Acidimicrobiales bacterium]
MPSWAPTGRVSRRCRSDHGAPRATRYRWVSDPRGVDLLALPTWQRARAGLFLALQHPTEVPGVSLESVVAEATRTDGRAPEGIHDALVAEAARIGFDERFVSRP